MSRNLMSNSSREGSSDGNPTSGSFTIQPPRGSMVATRSVPRSPSKLENPFFQEKMATLMQQGDTFAKKLDHETRRGEQLDMTLAQLRQQHLATKTALCNTTNSQRGVVSSDARNLNVLENRLEKVLTRFNQVCNGNKQLREQIQSLRREKVQHQQIHAKLDRETHQIQSELTKIAAATQAAVEARERATRQMEMVRTQQQDDTEEFDVNLYSQRLKLEHDRAGIREMPRSRTPKSTRPYGRVANPLSRLGSCTTPGGSSKWQPPSGFKLLSTPDVKLRDETMKNVWLVNEKETDLKRQSERLRAVEEGLAKIKSETGVSDTAQLTKELLEAEEKNFSLFNMISALNAEMEALEVENKSLEQLIEECRGVGKTSQEEEKVVNDGFAKGDVKAQMEGQIEKSKQKVASFEQRQEECSEAMDALKNGVLSIYHKLGPHADDAYSQQLNSHTITDVEITNLLGTVEQRITELVDMHNIATNAPASPLRIRDSAELSPTHNVRVNAKRSATFGVGMRPVLPSSDELLDSDGEDQEEIRPYKMTEIQEKTVAAVNRRREKHARGKR